MKRLRVFSLLVGLLLSLGTLHVPPAGAASCSAILVPSLAGQLAAWANGLTPGETLCLRGGVYPQTQLQLTASGKPGLPITLTSYPGERATLAASGAGGLWVRGAYWTVSNLILDNSGLANAALTVSTAAAHFSLTGSEVRHGSYYGLDVWAPNIYLAGNTVHDFQPADQVPGNDDQCHNIHGTASFGTLISSTIYNCWGDGIQFYNPLPNLITTTRVTGWLVADNTFRRGTLAYSENSIDVKGAVSMVVEGNDISGYDNAGRAGTCQPAVVFHGNAANVSFTNNQVHDSCQGVQISNGDWVTLTLTGNTFTNLGAYAVDFAGVRQGVFRNNTVRSAGEVFQVINNGWVGGAFDHNLIIGSGHPRLYPGAHWLGVTIGPNAWVNTLSDFLRSGSDLLSVATGFGVPAVATATPTATLPPVATATPTSTATATATVTPTATATPLPTIGVISTQACVLSLYSDGSQLVACPARLP